MATPKNDAKITFRLPSSEKDDLQHAADRRDRTCNWLARHIILAWLEKERNRSATK